VLLRSENFLSRSRGQLVAELGQKGDTLTPSSMPFLLDHTYFCIFIKGTKDFTFFFPSRLAAFSLPKKNKTLPT